jgi:hypothetical protein
MATSSSGSPNDGRGADLATILLTTVVSRAFASIARMARRSATAGPIRAATRRIGVLVSKGTKVARDAVSRVMLKDASRRKFDIVMAWAIVKGVGILKVAKSLGIGTGTVQRISGERAMSLRGAEQ